LTRTAIEAIPAETFFRDAIAAALEPLYDGNKGAVLWPFRVALTGLKASPPPFEVAEILGKERTLARVHQAIDVLP
jgi:glutamyl/glutaminyl-tRNA synthetase